MISPLYFTHTVTVERPTVTKGTSGGAKREWTAVASMTDIPASVQPASPKDISLFAGRNIQVSHSVYVETDPGFKRGDRLVVSDGRKFSVRGVIDFAGQGRLYKLVCRQILK